MSEPTSENISIDLMLQAEGIGMRVTSLEHLVRLLTFQTKEKGRDLTGTLHIGELKIKSQENTNDD
jgi:hypothetical protein